MKSTLTSKGQITIPMAVRKKFHLCTGDVLEFDENAPFLKAHKRVSVKSWERFGSHWQDPWEGMALEEVMDEIRGPVELPPSRP